MEAHFTILIFFLLYFGQKRKISEFPVLGPGNPLRIKFNKSLRLSTRLIAESYKVFRLSHRPSFQTHKNNVGPLYIYIFKMYELIAFVLAPL